MLQFREWLATTHPDLTVSDPALPLHEGDEGLRAFVDAQNTSFKGFLQQLLATKRITDPRLVQEAQALITDQANQLFDYGRELLRIASAGRGRLAGGDALQGATEAAGRLWELLWRPEAYVGTQTWEARFPQSAQRGGIRGTIRAAANNMIGHYAQRMRKGRAGVSTVQMSQIADPQRSFDVAASTSTDPGEWEAWKSAILGELTNDLNKELAKGQGGKHWEARLRNLQWAIAIANKQMEYPYQWRSMPEVMAEIPGLQGVRRGGLQQALKGIIDDARTRVVAKMGTEREQAVAHWLQTRRSQMLGRTRTEGCFPQVTPPDRASVESSPRPTNRAILNFREFVATHEGLLLPDHPVRPGMARINPFPATQKRLQRLFPRRPIPAKAGAPAAPLRLATQPWKPKPISSPVRVAQDALTGSC